MIDNMELCACSRTNVIWRINGSYTLTIRIKGTLESTFVLKVMHLQTHLFHLNRYIIN